MRFRDSMPRVTVGSEREDADGEIGDAGVAEALQSLHDRLLVAGRQQVADVGRVAELEQALVVRRVLGVRERLVGPRAGVVDFVVAAQRDRDPGHDARRRTTCGGGA